MNDDSICPCGSEKRYLECCGRYHNGAQAEDALKLMRSRYAAYVKQLPDYLMKTTHPDNPSYTLDVELWRKKILHFAQNTLFVGLEILEFVDGSKNASVTFTAYLKQDERNAGFTEKSSFEKVDGRWLYKDGQIKFHT
jgi:SEC-C motif domain protein